MFRYILRKMLKKIKNISEYLQQRSTISPVSTYLHFNCIIYKKQRPLLVEEKQNDFISNIVSQKEIKCIDITGNVR